jgi:hypothetical protein
MTLLLALSTAFADTPIEDAPPPLGTIYKRNLHGFRVGYSYAPEAPGYSDRVKSPHLFVMGYEFTQRLAGGDWLNVIAVENVLLSGLNQSLFIPTFNAIVGFEANEAFQAGVGVNVNVFDPNEKYVHMVMAGGFTADAGNFGVPIHFYYVPDVDGDYRMGISTGVNW